MLADINGSAGEGAELLGIELNGQTPAQVVQAIDRFVRTEQGVDLDGIDVWTDRCLPLGCLWGEQFVARFGWEWAKVVQHDHGNFKAIGVFSRDRSVGIYPFYFILGCLENQAAVTIALAFNMYSEGSRIPAFDPDEYTNLMDGVHHIIPHD